MAVATAAPHRAVAPEATLARVQGVLRRVGVTRLADITRLDRIGIPVMIAVRPRARGLSVDSGKGTTPVDAIVSAAMESIERWHGEEAAPPSWIASWEDVERRHETIPFAILPRTAWSPLSPRWPLSWTLMEDVVDGAQVAVPLDLVVLNSRSTSPLDAGMLQRSSNGLAAGNDGAEAIVSGLLEVIERDAVTSLLHAHIAGGVALPRVVVESVAWPRPRALLDRYADAQVLPVVYDCTAPDVGVPTFMVDLLDLRDRHVGTYRGYGAHLEAEVALTRALTEAAQSRSVFISGARDDIFRDDLARLQRADGEAALAVVRSRAATVDASAVTDAGPVAEALDVLVGRLADAGLRRVLTLDLTAPGMPVSAVRVVVPGLEGYRLDGYRPGERARARADGGV